MNKKKKISIMEYDNSMNVLASVGKSEIIKKYGEDGA